MPLSEIAAHPEKIAERPTIRRAVSYIAHRSRI